MKRIRKPPSAQRVLLGSLAVFLCAVLLVLGMACGLAAFRYSIWNARTSAAETAEQTGVALDHYFSGLEGTLIQFAHSGPVTRYCAPERPKSIPDTEQLILNNMDSTMERHPYIVSIALLTKQASLFSRGGAPYDQRGLLYITGQRSLLSYLKPGRISYASLTPAPLGLVNRLGTFSSRNVYPVSVALENPRLPGEQTVGTVLFFVDPQPLKQAFLQIEKVSSYTGFLLREDGSIYYCTDPSEIGGRYPDYLAAHGLVQNEDDCLFTADGRAQSHQIAQSAGPFRLVLVANGTQLRKALAIIASSLCLFCLLIFCSAFAIGRRRIRSFTQPLADLSHRMETMDYQTLSQPAQVVDSVQELQTLYRGYNDMLDRIRALLDQVSEERTRQQDARFEALQARINPHFLGNTLQCIASLAVLDRGEDVEAVAGALGDMMGYLTYESGTQVPLEKELEYTRRYVYIQQMRFSNGFSAEFDLDPESLGCRVSKLLVQPLVENAIVHGLEHMPAGAAVRISGRVEAQTLQITVTDNGRGIEPQRLQQLQQELSAQDPGSRKRVGLVNIQQRIRLQYGSCYGLTVYSTPGIGTRVQIVMPAIPYREENSIENSSSGR